MLLHPPFEIGPRLLPALRVGDGWLSLDFVGVEGRRAVYRWYADIPAGEFSEADLKSGWSARGYQEMFGSLLAFLGAAADSYAYRLHRQLPWPPTEGDRRDDSADLFPPAVVEWAHQYNDELACLQTDIEEVGAKLIEE